MLANCPVLLVEDDPYVALDLSSTIEELDGRVVGPTRDIEEALQFLTSEPVGAAILDWHLPDGDASRVALSLSERQIPFVIHSTLDLPATEQERHSQVPVLIKPLQPRTVVARLIVEIRKGERQTGVPSAA